MTCAWRPYVDKRLVQTAADARVLCVRKLNQVVTSSQRVRACNVVGDIRLDGLNDGMIHVDNETIVVVLGTDVE